MFITSWARENLWYQLSHDLQPFPEKTVYLVFIILGIFHLPEPTKDNYVPRYHCTITYRWDSRSTERLTDFSSVTQFRVGVAPTQSETTVHAPHRIVLSHWRPSGRGWGEDFLEEQTQKLGLKGKRDEMAERCSGHSEHLALPREQVSAKAGRLGGDGEGRGGAGKASKAQSGVWKLAAWCSPV